MPTPAQRTRATLPPTERAALLALYQSTGGDGWTDRSGWLGPEGSEGDWYGVTLDEAGEHVVALSLHENHLTGSLPPEIGDFPRLEYLGVGDNALAGSLPTQLGNLSALLFLEAWGNGFSGELPPSLGQLSHLMVLDFGGSALTGPIPSTWSGLSALENLYLNDNALTGYLPSFLGQLPSLSHLGLNGNGFTGEIPAEWGGLTSLQTLWLASNPLSGDIPGWLGTLTDLRDIDLSSCGLTGPIPENLGSLSQLESLVLAENGLTGTIPASLANLPALTGLALNGNALSGPIPPGMWQMSGLHYLDLSRNDLGGTIPPEVAQLAQMRYLLLAECGLSGPIPPQVGSLPNLLYLTLHRNHLSGTIPAELGNLRTLQVLGLAGNAMVGGIPTTLSQLTALEEGWGIGLEFNGLYTSDPALRAFLEAKGNDWEGSQTVAPENLAVQAASGGTARLSWTRIAYTWDEGGYRVLSSTDPAGPYEAVASTPDKEASWIDVGGLQPATTYYFKVQAFTAPHFLNPNEVASEPTAPVAFTTASCALSCQASVSPNSGPASLLVQFQSLVTSGGCDGTPSLLWDFGDGETSTEEAPSHLYRYTGYYEWTLRATVGTQICTTTGAIEVGVGVATGEGTAGIWAWEELYALDGPGVSDAVLSVADAEGNPLHSIALESGQFTLPELPTGDYLFGLTFTYEDHVDADALWGSYGCAGPGVLPKQVTVPPQLVQLGGGANRVDLRIPPPLVFLHGGLECFRRWYSGDPSDPDHALFWDNAARAEGVITFTPNYPGWTSGTSWDTRAVSVLNQLDADLAGLHAGASSRDIPPYVLLAYDIGGLVARALLGGPRWDDPRVLKALEVYLLGTPNSGSDYLLSGGEATPVTESAIMENFNELYPDYGMANVFCIAGDAGWWSSVGGDGPVTLYSAFNISRVACYGSATGYRCLPYVWTSFDSGEGHVFHASHRQLGGPATTRSILLDTILPMMYYRAPHPESPAGSTMWGTGARTVGSAQGSTQSLLPSELGPMEFPFTISPTQGMGVMALVRGGAALLEVLDPTGAVVGSQTLPESAGDTDGPGMELLRVAPPRGEWRLRVTPTEAGATFEAVMVESSAFDLFGYLGREVYGPGDSIQVYLDAEGDLTGVTLTTAEVSLEDDYGNPHGSAPLYDDGQHDDGEAGDGSFGGIIEAPQDPDSYAVRFVARGYYINPADTLERLDEGRLEVIQTDHLFTGSFGDRPEDRDGDGKSDTIVVTAPFEAPAPGTYLVGGDLYDANGYWVEWATAYAEVSGAGSADVELPFDLSGATCDQFAGPFEVAYLELLDGSSYETLDFWWDPVYTQAYSAADFQCQQGSAGPRAYEVYPDQGAPGKVLEVLVSGESFTDQTTLQFGGGISLQSSPERVSPYLIAAEISIPQDAASGYYNLTVANPGTLPHTLQQAFEVRADGAPEVEMLTPWDGDEVSGSVWLAASAWDDGRIERVTFLVDSAEVATLTSLPFQVLWDSATVDDGLHTITAVALDDTGQSAVSSGVEVLVTNASVPGDCDGDGAVSIGEVQKAINMFLGIQAPGCGVDCNGDGTISIGEVQKVINAFLGIASSC